MDPVKQALVIPSQAFVDRRAFNDFRASKFSAAYTWVLSGSVAMAFSSVLDMPLPTPIARTVTPASRSFWASAAVRAASFDCPSVTTIATFGTFGLSPEKKKYFSKKCSIHCNVKKEANGNFCQNIYRNKISENYARAQVKRYLPSDSMIFFTIKDTSSFMLGCVLCVLWRIW